MLARWAGAPPPLKRQKTSVPKYRYERSYYKRAKANEILDYLKTMEFGKDSKIMLYGKLVRIPRLQVAYGEPDTSYRYSGVTVVARDWTDEPVLQEMADDVEREVGERPNLVLINCYRDGKDKLGWHRDDEADLVGGKPIVSITFGAERDFVMRKRDDHTIKKTQVLHHGSLLVMTYEFNHECEHTVPARTKVLGARYNLTWRFTGGKK